MRASEARWCSPAPPGPSRRPGKRSAPAAQEGDTEIGELSFGDTEVADDEARVETHLTHIGDDGSTEVSFETVLVRQEGEWLVDLNATTSRMVGSILGDAVGEAFEEGVRETKAEREREGP